MYGSCTVLLAAIVHSSEELALCRVSTQPDPHTCTELLSLFVWAGVGAPSAALF